MSDDLVAGLDIGTSKVCAIIGEPNDSGDLEITGVGKSPSAGIRKGVVVNIESVLHSISQAVEAAEMMSGRVVTGCWVGVGGSHIESLISRGVVAVNGKNREQREISREDVERVLDAARAVDFPMDRQILDVIPQTYIVDSQSGIRDPLDMIGVRLESEVNIITCSMTSAQNLVRCVNRAGFRVEGLVLQTLAAGRAVLTDEEKELGVALIDLGGGTTNLLVYHHGSPYLTASIPAGGAQVSGDLSIVKNVSAETAERIKMEAGCCWEPLLEKDEDVIVPGMSGRAPFPIPRSQIVEIIRPRMEETFMMVKEKLRSININKPLGAGIVLTGGGANLLGAADLAAAVFNTPVRVGCPLPVGGLVDDYRDSMYATAVGLVLEGSDRSQGKTSAGSPSAVPESIVPSFFSKIGDWFKREFF
ncbi:MAG: cell division protein FtsA [Spirochaetaceae bacterium]|jgi:cell division protein FtsA|nr:cell division protein FtsA [Spirochaetaceae bacterium]